MKFLKNLLQATPKVVPTHIATMDDFKAHVLESQVPVVVDVWSESCAPCRQLAPVLVKVATKYQGRVRIAELSTEAEPILLRELGVRATPTLLIYHGGEELGRVSGFRPEGWFDKMIETEFPES